MDKEKSDYEQEFMFWEKLSSFLIWFDFVWFGLVWFYGISNIVG